MVEFSKEKSRKSGYRNQCKVCAKKYWDANKIKFAAKKLIYRNINKEKIAIKNSQWNQLNKVRNARVKAKYIEANREKIKSRQAAYQRANAEKLTAYRAEYYQLNKEKTAQYARDHRSEINAQHKNRRSLDLCFKLAGNLRSRLRLAISNNQKSGSAVRDLGCSVEELKLHLESKFQPGMSWENWSRQGWHIDHIKPLASFDLTDRNQFLQACHFTNLQPLWAIDNFKKSDIISQEVSF